MSVVNMSPTTAGQPLFFGEKLGLQRYDYVRYPKLVLLRKQMASYFWIPDEINLTEDRVDYQSFSESDRHIWTSNLEFQIFLDSVQGRGLMQVLGPHVSSPELESALQVWQYFENIHSISYTHIIENLYPDPKVVFDDILVNPQIRKRGMTVCREYNRLADITSPTKEDIYRLLLSVNILEGIRFYISFACSFAFADQGQMEKSAIILTKIAQDENMHLQTSQFLLNQLPLEDAEWAEVAKTNREWAIDQFEVAVHEELEWSEYLFQFGPRLGLNHKITTQWMKYLGNIRLGALGLPRVFSDVPNHPIPWINPWLNSKANQPPAQETQLSAYLEGGGIAQGRVAQEDMEL